LEHLFPPSGTNAKVLYHEIIAILLRNCTIEVGEEDEFRIGFEGWGWGLSGNRHFSRVEWWPPESSENGYDWTGLNVTLLLHFLGEMTHIRCILYYVRKEVPMKFESPWKVGDKLGSLVDFSAVPPCPMKGTRPG
jgi:hypothetical protein